MDKSDKKKERRFSQEKYKKIMKCSEEEKTKREKDERGLWCNKWQYKLLKVCATDDEGIKKWNEWRKEHSDEDVWLEGADLERAYLKGALLKTGVRADFHGEMHLENAMFTEAHLEDADLMDAYLQGAKLWKSFLEGTCLRGAIVDGATLLWKCEVDRRTDCHGVGLERLRIDPQLKQVLEYNIRRTNWEAWYKWKDWYKSKPKEERNKVSQVLRWSVRLFWAISDYGRSTGRIVGWFFGLAIAFAIIYYAWGAVDKYGLGVKGEPGIVRNLFVETLPSGEKVMLPRWIVPLRTLYFSVVTQTTLGFGDMYANAQSVWGHILLSVQVILGYVLLGALVTRFAVLFTAGGPAGKFAKEKRCRRAGDKLGCEEYHEGIFGALKEADEEVFKLITKEYERLQSSLQLVAAENRCSRAVLAALGSVVQNKTAEGFAGGRLHSGCEVVDEIERLAIDRAKEAFGAQYANVQPHCGTAANLIVITALLEKGDKILSLPLEQGGHFSHGSEESVTAKFFDIENYVLDKESCVLDYDSIGEVAGRVRPKLIICGASVYSRTIDFEKFRQIADGVGAYLLADISHISGLVIAGAHPSPIDYAHFTTTSTYKPGGPRGGLILMGSRDDRRQTTDDRRQLWKLIEKATFPGLQGTPYLNNIAAKAVFFKETLCDEYKARQFKIIENAKRLSKALLDLGYDVLTGGTDNHMILVNVANSREGLTGVIARSCLEECGLIVDRVELPYERQKTIAGNGLRLGTPIVTKNGMGSKEMGKIAEMIDAVLKEVGIVSSSEYKIEESFKEDMRSKVKDLCTRFPVR